MSVKLTTKGRALVRPRNTMAFPRELRNAIPDLHAGRVLELDSINGQGSNIAPFGRLVQLKLVVKETGKLTGKYVIGMALQIDAARQPAATLTELADEAERKGGCTAG